MDLSPKLNLLYFKHIVNDVFISFFNTFNNEFVHQDNVYIFASKLSKFKLKLIFKELIISELKKYIKPYELLKPNYYIIIGSCTPKNNLLLSYKTDKYFPEKLNKIINDDKQIKYFLREHDIKLDLVFFNTIICEIFDELFNNKNIIKLLGPNYTNVLFIQHKKLDCYLMFKVLKYLYGQKNCINLYKLYFRDQKSVIYSINELIDKYISNMKILNQSEEMKLIVAEVKEFISAHFKFLS